MAEKRAKHAIDVDDATFARWSFLVTEQQRCALAIAQLAKSVFGEQHQQPALDLVAMLSTQPHHRDR